MFTPSAGLTPHSPSQIHGTHLLSVPRFLCPRFTSLLTHVLPNLQTPQPDQCRDPSPHSHLISNNDSILSTRQRIPTPLSTCSISLELTVLRGKCYRWPHFTDEKIKALVKLPKITSVAVEGSRIQTRPFSRPSLCYSHCALQPWGQPCRFVLSEEDLSPPPGRKLPEERVYTRDRSRHLAHGRCPTAVCAPRAGSQEGEEGSQALSKRRANSPSPTPAPAQPSSLATAQSPAVICSG